LLNFILPGLVGTLIAAAGIGLLIKSRATAQWRQVAGTVVDVAIDTVSGAVDSNPTTIFYSATLHYKYVVNGVVRRGSRTLVTGVTSRANAVSFGQQYASGDPIAVFIDEVTHQHGLTRGTNHQYWWLVAIGVFWIGLAFHIAGK